MNSPFKLLIDENIGKPIGSVLVQLLKWHPEPPEIAFVVDRFGGQKDHIWVPQVAQEGWVILSTDRAKQCGGAKLHHVCEEHKVTHILMSATMHELKQFHKVAMVIRLWDKIVEVRLAPPGSRFHMKFHASVPVVVFYQRKPKKITPFKRIDEEESQKA